MADRGEDRTVTFKGLNCWYKSMVEKLGWMVISKDHLKNAEHEHKEALELKLKSYKASLKSLHHHLANSIFNCEDKNKDLKIMADHIGTLDYVVAHLSLPDHNMLGGKRRSKKSSKKGSKKSSKRRSKK